jgi:hypothetical protein
MGRGDIITAGYHNGIVNHVASRAQSPLADFGSGRVSIYSGYVRAVGTGGFIYAQDVNSLIDELEAMCSKSGYYSAGGRVNIGKVGVGQVITDIMGSIVNKANEIASYCLCYGNCRQTCRGGCQGSCQGNCQGSCQFSCTNTCLTSCTGSCKGSCRDYMSSCTDKSRG